MTLAITLIVKNETEVLARAIGGAEKYADQLIIVDTGSTDGTAELARTFTSEVYDFKWRDDFSAARNYALSKVKTDYWMWLDADDTVPPESAARLLRLKSSLSADVYMLPYVLGTYPDGKPSFSYYRERIIRRGSGLVWSGRVHEAVPLAGRVERKDIRIIHAKPEGRPAGTRNLDIYRRAAASGAHFSARDRYYFARELYHNGLFAEAETELSGFLREPAALAANRIDACVLLARCRTRAGDTDGALSAVFNSFVFGAPTGEACCEAGSIFFSRGDIRSAAYWYERAARIKPDMTTGAFINADCYGFLPYVWLTVCYDRLGEKAKAYRNHLRAARLRPDHPSVIANGEYFKSLGF